MKTSIVQNYEEKMYVKTVIYAKNSETYSISNFIMEAEEIIQSNDSIELHIKFKRKKLLNDTNEQILIFTSDDFQDTKKFRKKMNSQNMEYMFTGNDADLEYIKSKIVLGCEINKIGLNYIGLVKNKDQWQYIDKKGNNQFITLDNNILNSNFDLDELPTEDELKEIAKGLFNFNDNNIVYPSLCSAVNCILNERLFNLKIKIPILNMTGESGSGKSTTFETIISNICHCEKPEVAANIKEFAAVRLLSSSNIIPFTIEEYKEYKLNSHRRDLISALVRSVYDKHNTRRGKMDQSLNDYNLIAPMIIVGESSFDETAIKERTIVIMFSKNNLQEEYNKSMTLLKNNSHVLYKLGNLIVKEAKDIEDKTITEIYKDNINFNDDFPDRIKSNVSTLMISYHILHKIFSKICNMKPKKEVFEIIKTSQKEFNLNDAPIISVVENTFEIISNMIEEQILKERFDYVLKDQTICLRLPIVYNKITKYIKEYNIQSEVYNKKSSFASQVERSQYFISKNTAIRAEWNNKTPSSCKKCYVFDLEKIAASIDFCLCQSNEDIINEENKNKIPYLFDNDKFSLEGIKDDLPMLDDLLLPPKLKKE